MKSQDNEQIHFETFLNNPLQYLKVLTPKPFEVDHKVRIVLSLGTFQLIHRHVRRNPLQRSKHHNF